MAKCHSILAFGLLIVWTAMPALACLPTTQMTPSEMACCKRMAGDCHRGVGEHPCCKSVSNVPSAVASIQPNAEAHNTSEVVAKTVIFRAFFGSGAESDEVALGLPPPAPPGQYSLLRI
jgi:hypothetical protein